MEAVQSSVDMIWIMLGAMLVFFMHAGFAMVEMCNAIEKCRRMQWKVQKLASLPFYHYFCRDSAFET
ncbi:hypothetical protein, partial [Metaplanococcus flavidus]